MSLKTGRVCRVSTRNVQGENYRVGERGSFGNMRDEI